MKVELLDDFERDPPKIITHARHFVEIVAHTHNYLYGRKMIMHYLDKSYLGNTESVS